MKVAKVKVEITLDQKAWNELVEAFSDLNEATEDMPWLNESKNRMFEAIKNTRFSTGRDVFINDFKI